MIIPQEIKYYLKFSIITFIGIFGIGVYGTFIIWYGYNLYRNEIISDLVYELIAFSPIILSVLYILFIIWWSSFRNKSNLTSVTDKNRQD